MAIAGLVAIAAVAAMLRLLSTVLDWPSDALLGVVPAGSGWGEVAVWATVAPWALMLAATPVWLVA